MTLVTVSDAAKRLGISARQVQYLVAQGDLVRLTRGVLDGASVERLAAVRGGSHTRAWSAPTAWGAIALLAGADAPWMGSSQRSRLRARLRDLNVKELVERTRERAHVTRYHAHPSAGPRLIPELIRTANTAGRLGLTETTAIDGYLSSDDLGRVVSWFGLIRDDGGRVTLRATTMDLSILRDLAGRGVALAALDLAESFDPRERRAGREALDHALVTIRG